MALRKQVAILNLVGEARSTKTIMVTRPPAAPTPTSVRSGSLPSMRSGFILPISVCRPGLSPTPLAVCSIPATSLLLDYMRAETTCSQSWEAPTQDQASRLDRRSRLPISRPRTQRDWHDYLSVPKDSACATQLLI